MTKVKTTTASIELSEGVSEEEMRAVLATSPIMRHADRQTQYAAKALTFADGQPAALTDVLDQLKHSAARLRAKDTGDIIDMLSVQARTLDAVSDRMLRKADAAEYLPAFEAYMRFALKAQASSRATLEALAKIIRGGEQIIRHVHVHDGGQAVIADTLNNVHGGGLIRKSEGQSDATINAKEGAALPSPDPVRNGVPIPSRQRQAAVSNARRD